LIDRAINQIRLCGWREKRKIKTGNSKVQGSRRVTRKELKKKNKPTISTRKQKTKKIENGETGQTESSRKTDLDDAKIR
jgi:hypothetical protein